MSTGGPRPAPIATIRSLTPCCACGDDMWPGERAYPVEDVGIRCLICQAKRIPVVREFVEAVERRITSPAEQSGGTT